MYVHMYVYKYIFISKICCTSVHKVKTSKIFIKNNKKKKKKKISQH